MKKIKILIVDDKNENIDAAKIAVARMGFLNVAYAKSTKEAIELIVKAYETEKTFFDLVISDLEMEEKVSGMQVIVKAGEYLALPFIVTGRRRGGHGHGPSTLIEPMGKVIDGEKDDSRTWGMIFQEIIGVSSGASYQQSLESLRDYRKFVGKPSSMIAEILMLTFKSPI